MEESQQGFCRVVVVYGKAMVGMTRTLVASLFHTVDSRVSLYCATCKRSIIDGRVVPH